MVAPWTSTDVSAHLLGDSGVLAAPALKAGSALRTWMSLTPRLQLRPWSVVTHAVPCALHVFPRHSCHLHSATLAATRD